MFMNDENKLQENAHAEMVARKKTQGKDNRQAPFNSLAVVLTESSGCLTRLIDLIANQLYLYEENEN